MKRCLILLVFGILFLALRVEHSTLFYDLGRDKRYQMIGAGNLADGNGLRHCITFADDISNTSCQELTWWSAGYPVIVAGIYKVTGDLVTSDFILLLLGSLAFLAASYRFFSLWIDFKADYWTFVLFLVFAGFSFTPFNYLGTTTDLWGSVLIILAISEASFGFRDRKISGFIFAGMAAFAAVSFKFSFLPLLAIVPVGLGSLALLRRETEPLKYILYFLTPLAAGYLLLYAVLPNHVLPPKGVWIQGWHWHNLLAQDPFGARSLFFIDFLFRRIDRSSVFGNVVIWLVQLLSIATIGLAAYAVSRFILRHLKSRDSDGRILSGLLGLLTVVIIVVYLAWLSVRLPTFFHPLYIPWTFVQETRYFGPAMLLLIYAVFILPLYLSRQHIVLRTLSTGLVLAVCCYALAFWTYKNYDYVYAGRVEGSFIGPHKDDAIVAEFLRRDTTLNRSTTVLGFLSHAEAYGYTTLLIETDPAVCPFPWYDWYVGSIPIATSQPRTLLVTIQKSPTFSEREMIERYGGARMLELSTYDLYRLEVFPATTEYSPNSLENRRRLSFPFPSSSKTD